MGAGTKSRETKEFTINVRKTIGRKTKERGSKERTLKEHRTEERWIKV